jgi:hypothetical protein
MKHKFPILEITRHKRAKGIRIDIGSTDTLSIAFDRLYFSTDYSHHYNFADTLYVSCVLYEVSIYSFLELLELRNLNMRNSSL